MRAGPCFLFGLSPTGPHGKRPGVTRQGGKKQKTMAHFLWPEPLSPAQLKRLEEHKYSASGRSLFEPPCQIFWNWLIQQIPTWIAPNTLTIAGLLVNILSTVVLVYFCPTATEEAPAWAFIMSALGLFIYQSLDAIDGKQARRTNSSSPLGELFDHGCDAVSTGYQTFVTNTCKAGRIFYGLTIAHMTKSELYLPDTALIGPSLLFLNQYFNSFIDEHIVLWIAMVFSLLDLTRYCTGVCLQIAAHLRIRVFSITPPSPICIQ
uniref:Cholinephosphotransferase 1 n=1 Tax=Mola mola TaxID=94237 RepID=A0A3Q3VKL1_MOLML